MAESTYGRRATLAAPSALELLGREVATISGITGCHIENNELVAYAKPRSVTGSDVPIA